MKSSNCRFYVNLEIFCGKLSSCGVFYDHITGGKRSKLDQIHVGMKQVMGVSRETVKLKPCLKPGLPVNYLLQRRIGSGMGLNLPSERYWPNLGPASDLQCEVKNVFFFNDEGILSGGHCDVGSMQRYTNSLKEVVKRTILNQEAIFRNQVSELHRLYEIQKSLMGDLRQKIYEKFNVDITSSSSIPISSKTSFSGKKLSKDHTFHPPYISAKLSSTQTENFCMIKCGDSDSYSRKVSQNLLSLQLSADEYISQVNEVLDIGSNLKDSGNDMQGKSLSLNSVITQDVEFCLSTRGDSRNREKPGKIISEQRSYFCGDSDLYESTEMNEGDSKTISLFNLKVEVPSLGHKHEPQLGDPSDSFYHGEMRFLENSTRDGKTKPQERNPLALDAELNEHHNGAPWNLALCWQHSPSCEASSTDPLPVQLDRSPLNMCPPEACSKSKALRQFGCDSGKRIQSGQTPNKASFPTSPYHHFHHVGEKTDPTISPSLSMNPTEYEYVKEVSSCSKDMVNFFAQNKFLDLQTGSRSSAQGIDIRDEKSTITTSDGTDRFLSSSGMTVVPQRTGFSEPKVAVPKRIEDLVCKASLHENKDTTVSDKEIFIIEKDKDNELFPTTNERDMFNPKDSIPLTAIMQSNASIHQLRNSLPAKNVTPMKHTLSEKMHISSVVESQQEVDNVILTAAEVLMSINAVNSSDLFTSRESLQVLSAEMNEQSQCSSDSYESLTLNLVESNLHDYDTSKKLTDEKGEKTACTVSLRRGRRLKDFRKDVLPTLITLSRHEICEDLHSFEEVIRSTELKKKRDKKGITQSWCVPTRNKRSRIYFGR